MIIGSKRELKEIINNEKNNIFNGKDISIETRFRSSFKYQLYKYVAAFRKYEYACTLRDNQKGFLHRISSAKVKYYDRKKNKLSLKTGIDYSRNVGKNVTICHPNVILNGSVGDGCVFHGNNVLGNKRSGDTNATPVLGENVDVGIGAIIIGDVYIADNCVIGAGAVVTKSFEDKGAVIAGVPAKQLNNL